MAESPYLQPIMPSYLGGKTGNLFQCPIRTSSYSAFSTADAGNVRAKLLLPELIVERACHAPARLFQVEDRGYLREGYWADIVVVNPAENTQVKKFSTLQQMWMVAFFPFNFHKLDRDHYRFRTDCFNRGEINLDCRGKRAAFSKDRR